MLVEQLVDEWSKLKISVVTLEDHIIERRVLLERIRNANRTMRSELRSVGMEVPLEPSMPPAVYIREEDEKFTYRELTAPLPSPTVPFTKAPKTSSDVSSVFDQKMKLDDMLRKMKNEHRQLKMEEQHCVAMFDVLQRDQIMLVSLVNLLTDETKKIAWPPAWGAHPPGLHTDSLDHS